MLPQRLHCHRQELPGCIAFCQFIFKRPDLIQGLSAMSGDYDLQTYTDGYYDEQVYFNSRWLWRIYNDGPHLPLVKIQ